MLTLVVLVFAGLGAVGLPGCGDGCPIGYQEGSWSCSTAGTVTAVSASASAGVTPPKPTQIVDGLTCATGGGCAYGPSFRVATTSERMSQAEVFVSFELPPDMASGSFRLPSKSVRITGTFRGATLEVVSGTLELQSASQAGFVSPFDVVLATSDGAQLTLSGQAVVSNCHLDSMCGVL